MRRARRRAILATAIGGMFLASSVRGDTTVSWLAPADGTWTDPAAWSSNPLYPNNGQPNPFDLYDAVIAASGNPYTVTLNSDITISSLLLNSASATFSQTGGTLRLVDGGATLSAGDYVLSSGTLSADDPITVASQMHWFDGAVIGFGPLNVTPTGSLNLGSSSARVLSTQINNSGIINFTDGVLTLSNGTINNQAGGVLNLSGTATFSGGGGNEIRNSGIINVPNTTVFNTPVLNSATINVTGSLTFNSGTFTQGTGAIIAGNGFVELNTQNVTGTLTLAGSNVNQSNGTISGAGNIDLTGTFNLNNGTINGPGSLNIKPTGALNITASDTHVINRSVNNAGTIAVNSFATFGGALTNLPTGVININNGTILLTSPTGMIFNRGTINMNTSNGGITTVDSGTITIVATLPATISGTFENGAIINGGGTAQFGVGPKQLDGTLNLATDVVLWSGGGFTGTGNLNLTRGFMSWSDGYYSSSGAFNISSGALVSFGTGTLSGTINNSGTLSTNFANLNDGTINNLAGGFLKCIDTAFVPTGTLNLIRNSGTMTELMLSSTYTFNAPLVNNGTLLATTTGTLTFATMSFGAGTYTHTGGAVINAVSPANIELGGSTLTTQIFSGPVTVGGNLFMSGGTLQGSGDMNLVSAGFTIVNSVISGTGALNIDRNSAAGEIGGIGTISRAVNNSGTLQCSRGLTVANNINSTGTILINNGGSMTVGSSLFTNSGTVQVGTGTSSGTLIVSTSIFNNAGTLNLAAGTVLLSFGTLNNLASGTINFGSLCAIGGGSTLDALSNTGAINVNLGSANIGTISGQTRNFGTININAGTLNLSSNNTLNNLNSGTINVAGAFNIGAGTMTHGDGSNFRGAGTINLSGNNVVNGTLTLAGSKMRFSSGAITGQGNIDMSGSLNWTGGTFAGSGALAILPGATLTVSSGSSTLSQTINNSGVMNLTGGSMTISTGTISNLAGATINIGSAFSVSLFPGTGVSLIRNDGLIDVNNATPLLISSKVLDTATINISAGTLLLGNSTFTYSDGAIFTGPGFVNLGNGAVSQNFLNGSLTLAGSNVNLGNGTMQGTGNLEVTGSFSWNGGTISGAGAIDVLPGAAMTIGSGANARTLSRTLNNSGMLNINNSFGFNGGTIVNNAGAVISIGTAVFSGASDLSSLIVNNGTIKTNFGLGVVSFTQTMINSGTINVPSGSLQFSGTFTHNAGAIFTGQGTIDLGVSSLSPSTHLVNGTLTISNDEVHLNNATLTGPGNIDVANGRLLWENGTLSGDGILAVKPTGTIVFLTNGTSRSLSRTMNDFGTFTIFGGALSLNNGTINNQSTGYISAQGGTFTVNSGTGTLNRFSNAGTLSVDAGSMTIAVPFSNSGTIALTGGATLQITGNVSQVIGATLTGGTWAAHVGSTISIPGTSITNNAANVTLDGVGSSFDAINPINNNAGTFQLIGGRTFVTSASYTNSGRTVVGTNSALDINGDLMNTGTVDVGGIVVVDYSAASPIATIASQVAGGHAGGSWNGIGINSTAAAQNAGPTTTGVGYADASALGIVGSATFAGQPVNDTSVIIRYTLLGDSNLDSSVNALDFGALASHFGSTSAVWSDGDFNYDGAVNTLDFNAMAANFGAAMPASPDGPLGDLVPEPGLAVAFAAWLAPRYRPRRRTK